MITKYRYDKSNSLFSTGNKDKSAKNVRVWTKAEIDELNKCTNTKK